ncbi:MAG TPA: GAF domain-containing protein, partial [Nitrolancea sp.]|nr:GAF domain-containing protein [Nitrolancea sp.]
MSEDAIRSLLGAFQSATGVGAAWIDDLPRDVVEAAYELTPPDGVVAELRVGACRYLTCRTYPRLSAIIAFGPYRRPDDEPADCPMVDSDGERQLVRTLEQAGEAIGQILEDRASALELASQFELISDAVIAISSELSLDVVLRRIVDLARELVGARYAALGIPDGQGGLSSFLTSGISEEDAARIGNLPQGRGILGLLLREPKALRLADLSEHPESVGFPPNHPPMKSFLGVPIVGRGRVLGNLY